MNKYKLYMILSISILILSISGTFAWYVWTSSTNALVKLDICTPTITFAGGSTINGTNMIPVLTKEEGTIKDIEVKANTNCTKEVTMNLYLELTTLPTELSDNTFVYELYKDNELITNGNFSNHKEGDTITLISNKVLTTSKDTYTLYIYINGNYNNNYEMAGKNFLFKVCGSGTGAIYKENVIENTSSPSSSTDAFFSTEVMREEIETLTIAEDNTVPEGATSKDISSNKDGSVMLWYTKNDNDKYDMYIGGKNGVIQLNTNASGMFAYLTNIEKLDLSRLDTSNITNMSRMFYKSTGLKEIDLSNFNTSNVTNMASMFEGCSSLASIDVSSFDTSNVTTMGYMFYKCRNLTSLNISFFNTSNVTDMKWMFTDCVSLTSLDLSSFDTSNVTTMSYMFYYCISLTGLDLSTFNTSKVTNMELMFSFDYNLEEIIFGDNFDTSNVTTMEMMFHECDGLTVLDLSNFNTSKVENMRSMFFHCNNLTTIYVSDLWNTDNVTNSEDMFIYSYSLSGYDSTKLDKSMANYTTGYFTYKAKTNN